MGSWDGAIHVNTAALADGDPWRQNTAQIATTDVGAPMAGRRNHRQRKKLRIGEYQELGFEVSAQFKHPLESDRRDALLDVFLAECIEANGMLFGGGMNDSLGGFIVDNSARGSATDDQREQVCQWLKGREEFAGVEVAPLTDAWYGHD